LPRAPGLRLADIHPHDDVPDELHRGMRCEELGLHGSIHYAGQAFDNDANIAGVLNLDMIAYDPDLQDIDLVTNEGSEWLVEAMLSIQKEYNLKPLILKKIVKPEMVYSDHAPFWHNGYNAILGIDNHDFDSPEFNPVMHTTEDTADQLDFDMFTKIVQISIGTLASLADPIGSEPHPDLAVTDADVHLSPQNPAHGESVSLTASVHNVGEADAQGVLIQVWLVEPVAETPRLVQRKWLI